VADRLACSRGPGTLIACVVAHLMLARAWDAPRAASVQPWAQPAGGCWDSCSSERGARISGRGTGSPVRRVRRTLASLSSDVIPAPHHRSRHRRFLLIAGILVFLVVGVMPAIRCRAGRRHVTA
jgi:hypothetical protein